MQGALWPPVPGDQMEFSLPGIISTKDLCYCKKTSENYQVRTGVANQSPESQSQLTICFTRPRSEELSFPRYIILLI